MGKDRKNVINKLKESLFNFGSLPQEISEINVNNYWSPFGIIEGDSAIKLDLGGDNELAMIWRTSKAGTFPNHSHPQDEVLLVLDGGALVKTPYMSKKISKGDNIIIPAKVPHKFFIEKDSRFLIIYPDNKSNDWQATQDYSEIEN